MNIFNSYFHVDIRSNIICDDIAKKPNTNKNLNINFVFIRNAY